MEKGKSMEFTVTGGNQNAKITIDQEERNEVLYATIHVEFPEPECPEKIRVLWKFKDIDCYSVWSPHMRYTMQRTCLGPAWFKSATESRLASGMPLHQIVSLAGQNRLTIAVSDCATPIRIATGLYEEDACIDCQIDFFTLPTTPISSYSAVIRLDMRNIKYYDSIYDTVRWWEEECGYKPLEVPEAARLPMNSLWYSYHQMLDKDEIVKECRLSKPLGMETVIVDDGWETDDNSRGYAYCGDWQVAEKKIGDMAELVRRVHAEGMKMMIWYSVPYIGIYSEKYEQFKDMLLDGSGNEKTYFALDPRYKEVRDYLIGIYTNAVKDWDLDGLKLDFIDSFVLKGKSLEVDERRDYSSLEEAIDVLLTETMTNLHAIKEDILIEFRQSYIGPSIRKYGNMLRVGDCPNDAIINRDEIINLRYTSGKTAVHSDMIMWNMEDTVEAAALQFASILYSVPQISVRMEELPENHYKMLKYYLSFWLAWREVLLDGKITAENPESDYSQVAATLGNKSVITVYTNQFVEIEKENTVIVNASGKEILILRNATAKKVRVVNCMGEEIATYTMDAGIEEVKVPMSGMIFVEA